MPSPVLIANCPEHGFVGVVDAPNTRANRECRDYSRLGCTRPVERVAMVPAEALDGNSEAYEQGYRAALADHPVLRLIALADERGESMSLYTSGEDWVACFGQSDDGSGEVTRSSADAAAAALLDQIGGHDGT